MHVLEWKMTTEAKQSNFIIERKYEAGDFVQIGKVVNSKNVYSSITYKYADCNVLQKGIYFYRLKQIKDDGTFCYQRLVKVFVFEHKNNQVMNMQPQHLDSNFLIEVKIPGNEQNFLKIEVQNEMGNVVVSEIINTQFNSDLLEHHLNLSGLPVGSYDVVIHLNNQKSFRKLVKY